jgi:hypothetical protein
MKRPLKLIVFCRQVIVLLLILAGCASSIYEWQVRTNSTPMASSFSLIHLAQEPVALFGAVASSGKSSHEVALADSLDSILRTLAVNWKIMGPQEAVTRINRAGLTAQYASMKSKYGNSNILDRDTLRKLAATMGVRYVFQPRLVEFTQTMTDRWTVPVIEV